MCIMLDSCVSCYIHVRHAIFMCVVLYSCASCYIHVPRAIFMCIMLFSCASCYIHVHHAIFMCIMLYSCASCHIRVHHAIFMCVMLYSSCACPSQLHAATFARMQSLQNINASLREAFLSRLQSVKKLNHQPWSSFIFLSVHMILIGAIILSRLPRLFNRNVAARVLRQNVFFYGGGGIFFSLIGLLVKSADRLFHCAVYCYMHILTHCEHAHEASYKSTSFRSITTTEPISD